MFRKLSGKSKKTAYRYKGDERLRFVIQDCRNTTVVDLNVVDWRGSGDVTKGAEYAITIDNCHNVTFDNFSIQGAPDETDKDAWRNSVANGIRINDNCTNITIKNGNISRVHFGIDNRASATIENNDISFVSGDFILSRGNDTEIKGNKLVNSIQALPYDLIHRDYIQLFGQPELEGVTVENNVMSTDAHSHKWATDVDEAIIFSDGNGENIHITNNTITTNAGSAILLNPCVDSSITGNEIISDGKPFVGCEDRKNTGCFIDVEIADNGEEQSFSDWCDSLRNLSAPAVNEYDIEAAAQELSISPAMVAAVSNVESRGKGFNRDGSVRMLFERHKAYKYAKEAGCLSEMIEGAGSANCSPNRGGYIGGVSEYNRLKAVGEINADVALMSASYGTHQIMGFNHKLVGYDSAKEMLIAFRESEKNQLNAFVQFIISNNLARYLQEAEKLADAGKSPLKPLDSFANNYNGTEHDRYDLKIAAAYEAEKTKRKGYQPRTVTESTTVQGGIVGTVGTVGAGVVTLKEVLDGLKETRESVSEVTDGLKTEIDAINEKISEPNYLLWLIIGFLIIAQFGVFTSLWARIKDRFTGVNI